MRIGEWTIKLFKFFNLLRTKRRAVLTPRDIASDGPEIRFSDERSDYFRRHDLIAVNNTSRTFLYMRSSVPTSINNTVYDARNDLAYAIFATRRKLDRHRAACESCPAVVWSTELCCFSPQRYALKFRHSPNILAIWRTDGTAQHPFNYKT